MSEQTKELGFKDGILIEKGASLTSEFLERNEDLIQRYCNFWRLYPDYYLDLIKSSDCPINLFPYQRIFLRASMRYRYHYATYTRA